LSFNAQFRRRTESDRTRSLDSGDRLPPSRHSNFLSFADHDHIKPKTPREVQLLFHLDAAPCSPIPGIPEEEGDLSSSDRSDGNDNREVLTSTSRLSQSSTATTESGSRQRRPMPDMSAFDSEALFSRDRSSLGVAASSSTPPASPKLLCPPTPVRTPAWAHADTAHASLGGGFAAGGQSKLSRCNSLTVTKVLATCPLQVLEGRSSLENSLLEEEGGRNESNMSSAFGSLHHLDGSDHDTTIDADMEDAGSAASGEPSPFKQRQSLGEVGAVVSMTSSFEVLSTLGSGTFADVYKVRSRTDGSLYAIKRNRRQFRGKRDRDQALAEVRYMQRLQSIVATAPSVSTQNSSYCLHVLFFYQAWQEDGHFFCQTELCCRDTCRDLIDSVKTKWNEAKLRYPSVAKLEHSGRLVPESSVWKVCHDACAGLSHIHSHGLVHLDIKPSNIFFVEHPRYGPMCKIGDFGMTCEIGSSEDGQEGDQLYMSLESLTNSARHPSADIFSLGLTLYELASHSTFEVPVEGARWHELRSGRQVPNLPESRSADLVKLIGLMLSADVARRPTADLVLGNDQVLLFGNNRESFLIEYLRDASAAERAEVRGSFIDREDQTPRIASRSRVCSPPVGMMPPMAPMLYSP
jgi:membrane-associated tyrosine/threonine-specific cdc2-inhibitory kinase